MDQHFASLKRTKFAEGQSWETQTVLSEFCTNLIMESRTCVRVGKFIVTK